MSRLSDEKDGCEIFLIDKLMVGGTQFLVMLNMVVEACHGKM